MSSDEIGFEATSGNEPAHSNGSQLSRDQAIAELVPEGEYEFQGPNVDITGVDEGSQAWFGSDPPPGQPTQAVLDLLEGLRSGGLNASLRSRRGSHDRPTYSVVFDLPAGSSRRSITIGEEHASEFLGAELSSWRSFERYDGIYSTAARVAEVALQFSRFDTGRFGLIEHLVGGSTSRSKPLDELIVERSGAIGSYRLGEASSLFRTLSGARRLGARRGPLTLTIRDIDLTGPSGVESKFEELADSILFELDLHFDTNTRLSRLRQRSPFDDGSPRGRSSERVIGFPLAKYPHDPVMMYRSAREQSVSPLIRYWSYFQVLEYFYPLYVLKESQRRLAIILRDPRFNCFDDDAISRAIQTLRVVDRGSGGRDEEQLAITIASIIDDSSLRAFINDRTSLRESISDHRSEISTKAVNVKATESLTQQIARRVYDIRCRIVHSKSESEQGRGASLIPGSHHDDLVLTELPLVEYLAQSCLLAAAQPLLV